jgi:type VI secretion system protein ImpA
LEDLLTPRGDEAPSGENLEYDPVFTALLLAAQPGEERQAGNEIIAAEEPDHKEVVEKAREVLERSHDLRAAVILGLSELRLNGLQGLAGVTTYIRRCLEEYWDTCHPQLDADDDDDPTMRVNAVLGLADRDTVLMALRLAPLASSTTFGQVTLRDIMIAEGELPAPADGKDVLDPAAITAAFKDTRSDYLEAALAAARAIQSDVTAINKVFDERTPGLGPDLDPLLRMINRIVARLAEAAGVPEAAPEGEAEPAQAATQDTAPAAPGTITSQRDVRATLERIIDYYAKYEPSSPLPILLRRAHRLVGADFLTIVQDIAPSGVDNVRQIGGIEKSDE